MRSWASGDPSWATSRASRATAFRAKRPICGRRFDLIDTGGIIPNDAEMIPTEILKQARVALDRGGADHLPDRRADRDHGHRSRSGEVLRKLGKPVTLAVNKIDATVARGSGARISFARLQGSVSDFFRASDRVRRAAGSCHARFPDRRKRRKSRSRRSGRSKWRSSGGRTSENPRC